MKVDEILNESAALYKGRKEIYPSDNWEISGRVLQELLPNGVAINSAYDNERYHIFTWLIGKICRYAQNYDKGGHEDSLRDAIVYAAILKSIDGKINEIP